MAAGPGASSPRTKTAIPASTCCTGMGDEAVGRGFAGRIRARCTRRLVALACALGTMATPTWIASTPGCIAAMALPVTAPPMAPESRRMRRQLTLNVAPDQRAAVDRVRQRLDPKQYAIVPAHVTLCRDEELEPWPAIDRRLERLAPFSIRMQFGEPRRLADGCILLRPTHGMEPYQELRESILGASARHHGAHLTLLHPRNASAVECDLGRLTRELAGTEVTFRTVSLIEQQRDEPWRVLRNYGTPLSPLSHPC